MGCSLGLPAWPASVGLDRSVGDLARAKLAEFEAAGVERIMLQDFLPGTSS